MRVLDGVDELVAAEGEELGVSDWLDVTQERVDAFADVTGDHQWIHGDPERASQTPFGGTIAHGYFTLSAGPQLGESIYRFDGFAFGMNYGLNRVRFTAPMPVGGRLRMRAHLTEVRQLDSGVQVRMTWTFERDGGEKPVCVAEILARLFT
jgi:acyl dehydratase